MFKKLFRSIWLAILWSAIIFILLSIPGKQLPPGPNLPFFDKIIHIILFSVQTFLWGNTWLYRRPVKRRSIIGAVIFLSSVYGIALEYYQHYCVANRSFELGDIIADISGSLVGGLLALRMGKVR